MTLAPRALAVGVTVGLLLKRLLAFLGLGAAQPATGEAPELLVLLPGRGDSHQRLLGAVVRLARAIGYRVTIGDRQPRGGNVQPPDPADHDPLAGARCWWC